MSSRGGAAAGEVRWLDLVHGAGDGLLVRSPAQDAGAVPHMAAGDVIGADLDHQSRLQRDVPALMARPAGLATGRAAGEAGAFEDRFQDLADIPFGFLGPQAADVMDQAVFVVKAEQQILDGAAFVEIYPGDHAIDRLPELVLEHRADAGLIRVIESLGDDAV